VVDVPAKLAAQVRVFDTGNARKKDAVDAHAVAMVAVRSPRLNQLGYDAELIALRLLTDRRDSCHSVGVQTVNRLQRLLAELIPGGAKRDLSALQAKKLLASARPRTLVGKTLRRMAVEELTDLAVDAKLKAIKTELRAAVQARGSHLMDLHGVGPAGAARILSDVGDVARFPDRNHFASWTGTAPLTPPAVTRSGAGCPGPGTADSTTCCTSPRSCRSDMTPKDAPATAASSTNPTPRWRPCVA
jgi:transposase